MIPTTRRIFLILLFLAPGIYLNAKSYVMGSAGLQFDLGDLGNTISTDGLDSSTNYKTTATDGTPGVLPRRAVIAENRLLTLQHSSNGLISAKTNGAMTGLTLSLGYEQDFGKAFFWRVNAHYTRKIMGGDTEAKFAGQSFYHMTWDYNAIQIPVNVGIKLSVSEDASIYIGAGVHYFKGGWSLAGNNRLNDVHEFLVNAGITDTTVLGLVADGTDPSAHWENTKFNVSGVAPNWLLGAQSKISDKGHIYMEVETLFSFKYGIAHPRSEGGAVGLAPSVAYPQVLGGNQYRFGYKHEI
ncbi:porin OmpL1 [Leptospira selangorensis]|uniref:Porin OmpL1 n=1 Tax=Leptospira selangorensis TaxID=2484982 RepID=A0A5F2C6N5_9LEPT|nr:porin OmpL1 [Leptospira selangorensis]TGM12692.1 porin OmpL1 [Leptospira selangorensis]TGM30753.1 porin OmpL1 [Leptospira selangorensis]